MPKTVLITGADGLIGSHLRKALQDMYTLRLVALKPIPGEETIETDITDMDKMSQACQGVDSVVHLAASPAVDTPWDQVLHNNIVGTYTVYEAAQRAGVKQVIFASSNHAVGTYEEEALKQALAGQTGCLDHQIPIRPDSYYGASKAFGEALGAYYADHRGLHVICLRIGWINTWDKPLDNPATLLSAMWMSQRDFAQMVQRCLQHDDIPFDIFYGISNNTYRFFDLTHAREAIGFVPQD